MLPERPFQYVPATITKNPCTFIAVKYEDNRGHPMLWGRTRYAGVTRSFFPDRTIFEGSSVPSFPGVGEEEFDEILLTGNSTHPSALEDAGFRYGMASPHHTSSTAETRRNPHALIFSDSGGFQLLSGAVDFIDPEELTEYYNRAIDYGIGLDIPVFGHNDLLLRMLEVLLKNNKLMKKSLDPAVTLYEVSHGATLQTRKIFLDRLLKEKNLSNALAIGGIAQNYKDGGVGTTVISGAINLMYVLDRCSSVFRQFHVLGTTSTLFQALYWLIQEHGAATHITADSTSWIQPAINNHTLGNSHDGDVRLVTSELPKDLRSYSLRCSCPVCSMIKYPAAYVRLARSNQQHNLYTIANNVKLIEERVREYYDGKTKLSVLATAVAGGGTPARIAEATFKFCIDAAQKGFKSAYEKHYPTLKAFIRSTSPTVTLFEKQKTLTQAQTTTRKQLLKVLEAYEKHHKGRKR